MSEPGPLRSGLRRLLERERLDDRQYAELRNLIERGGSVDDAPGHRIVDRRSWLAAAASVVLLIAVAASYLLVPSPEDESRIPLQLADEVLTNHVRIRNPDIEARSMEAIRESFDRLDFVPLSSSLLDAQRLYLHGARYCTLQGAIAAQLMFRTRDGDRVTHYQAAYDPGRFGPLPDIDRYQQPLRLTHHGVEIRIWVERGLLMAEAGFLPQGADEATSRL